MFLAKQEARQLIMLHGHSVYVCIMYVCYSNAIITILVDTALFICTCSALCSIEPRTNMHYDGVTCTEVAVIREATCAATQK